MTMLSALASPAAWGWLNMGVWLLYVRLRRWNRLGPWERKLVVASLFSCVLFLNFINSAGTTFSGWADVYWWCGQDLQFCSCNFKWNARGWAKAIILWSFVLSAALGLQRVAIQLGLNGLLPGEEVITRESFISICWRLIPYWLNNWEQQWGAECSSMMFELPHFAVELLVILPCVQILCARMKILAVPMVNLGEADAAGGGGGGAQHGAEVGRLGAAPGEGADGAVVGGAAPPAALGAAEAEAAALRREDYAPNILKGCWELRPQERRLLPRLRGNAQVMGFTLLITLLAACNALLVPLLLEAQISHHPSTAPVKLAGHHLEWFTAGGDVQLEQLRAANVSTAHQEAIIQRVHTYATSKPPTHSLLHSMVLGLSHMRLRAPLLLQHVQLLQQYGRALAAKASMAAAGAPFTFLSNTSIPAYVLPVPPAPPLSHSSEGSTAAAAGGSVVGQPGTCGADMAHYMRNLRKHADEITKMQDAEHMVLIPLVESALAVMRLSCEKYFVLLSVFTSYLLFRNNPPRPVRAFIRMNAVISTTFQRVILYSFPAICWLYGAGLVFSIFVSLVFWGPLIGHAWESLRSAVCVVRIHDMRLATAAEVERMGGNCAVCWGDMRIAGQSPPAASSTATAHVHATAAPTSQPQLQPQRATAGAQPQPQPVPVQAAAAPAASASSAQASRSASQRRSLEAGPVPDGAAADPSAAQASGGQGSGRSGPGEQAAEQHPGAGSGVGGGAGEGGPGVVAAAAAAPAAPPAVPAAEVGAHVHAAAAGPAPLEPPTSELEEEEEEEAEGSKDAWSLPCGHAYHHSCLTQWLRQCFVTGATPTCPMCQATITLQVKYRFPYPWHPTGSNGEVLLDEGQGPGGDRALQPHIRNGRAAAAAAMQVPNAQGRQQLRRQQGGGGAVNNRGARPAALFLLPPPAAAAAGALHMLELGDFQLEVQQLLHDMPQLPMDLVAWDEQGAGEGVVAQAGGGAAGAGAPAAPAPAAPGFAAGGWVLDHAAQREVDLWVARGREAAALQEQRDGGELAAIRRRRQQRQAREQQRQAREQQRRQPRAQVAGGDHATAANAAAPGLMRLAAGAADAGPSSSNPSGGVPVPAQSDSSSSSSRKHRAVQELQPTAQPKARKMDVSREVLLAELDARMRELQAVQEQQAMIRKQEEELLLLQRHLQAQLDSMQSARTPREAAPAPRQAVGAAGGNGHAEVPVRTSAEVTRRLGGGEVVGLNSRATSSLQTMHNTHSQPQAVNTPGAGGQAEGALHAGSDAIRTVGDAAAVAGSSMQKRLHALAQPCDAGPVSIVAGEGEAVVGEESGQGHRSRPGSSSSRPAAALNPMSSSRATADIAARTVAVAAGGHDATARRLQPPAMPGPQVPTGAATAGAALRQQPAQPQGHGQGQDHAQDGRKERGVRRLFFWRKRGGP